MVNKVRCPSCGGSGACYLYEEPEQCEQCEGFGKVKAGSYCLDCGEEGEQKGHSACQYPTN